MGSAKTSKFTLSAHRGLGMIGCGGAVDSDGFMEKGRQ